MAYICGVCINVKHEKLKDRKTRERYNREVRQKHFILYRQKITRKRNVPTCERWRMAEEVIE